MRGIYLYICHCIVALVLLGVISCVGILCLLIATLVTLARNDKTCHCSLIPIIPTTARNVSIRAVGDYGDVALWGMGIVRAEHKPLKSVHGFGGLLRGIRGLLRN